MQFPQLYQETKRGTFFSIPVSGWWLLLSVVHSLIAYFSVYVAFSNDVDQIVFGSAVHIVVVLIVQVQILAHARYFTKLLWFCIFWSLVTHLCSIWFFSSFSFYIFDDLEYELVFDPILSSPELWSASLVACAAVLVMSLTAQHLRSVLCPRPFHVCPEIQRGHFSKSKRYPTRMSTRRYSFDRGGGGGGGGGGSLSDGGGATAAERSKTLRSKSKVLPTKSSVGLAKSTDFLKRYMFGLFLEYEDLPPLKEEEGNGRPASPTITGGENTEMKKMKKMKKKKKKKKDSDTGRLSPRMLMQLLQHRAPNQMNSSLPRVASRLNEKDAVSFIVELDDAEQVKV